MSEIQNRKLAEAEAAFEKGKQNLKKTLLRWKPDHEKASSAFEDAGNAFKGAKAFDKAREAFSLAAESYEKLEEFFKAGKNFDLAATMAKEAKQMDNAGEYYFKASSCFRLNGNPDKGADMLHKSAKMLEEVNADLAIERYVDACEIYQSEGKDIYSSECFKNTISFCVKCKKYDQAITMIERQTDVFRRNDQKSYLNKAILSIIVIELQLDDYVRADNDFQKFSAEISSFPGSDEAKAASGLLTAFETRDQEVLAATVKMPVFNFLDQQIIKMARALTLEGGVASTSSPTKSAVDTKSQTTAAAISTPSKSSATPTTSPKTTTTQSPSSPVDQKASQPTSEKSDAPVVIADVVASVEKSSVSDEYEATSTPTKPSAEGDSNVATVTSVVNANQGGDDDDDDDDFSDYAPKTNAGDTVTTPIEKDTEPEHTQPSTEAAQQEETADTVGAQQSSQPQEAQEDEEEGLC